VSVLLIDGRLPARVAPPAGGVNVNVASFRRPVIDSVKPLRAAAGATLALDGMNLRADVTRVMFRGGQAAPSLLGDNHLEAVLPATLPAGMQSVRVVHGVDFGTPGDPHNGPESNEVPFVLTPRVTVPGGPAPHWTVARGGTLTLAITPSVWRTQKVRLLVGDQTLTLPERLPSSPPTADASLDFAIPTSWPAGDFLLRVQVDGAESPLSVNPATRAFDGPIVRIT
jgi:hypothetical protein